MVSKFYYFMVYAHRLKGVLILDAHTSNLIGAGKYLKQKYILYSESDQVGIFDKKTKISTYLSGWGKIKQLTIPLLVIDNLSPFTPNILECLDKLQATYICRKYFEVNSSIGSNNNQYDKA